MIYSEIFILSYTSQFVGDETEIKGFLDTLPIPAIPQNLVEKLEAPLTQVEIALAMSSMHNGKSPGLDGFPAEFFKNVFCAPFPTELTAALSESLQLGSLPRVISLLNTDAKILAQVLAHRLEEVLPKIIAADQTGFIKGRHSFFNARCLFNIL